MLCGSTGGDPFWLYLQLLQLARAEDLIGVDLVEVLVVMRLEAGDMEMLKVVASCCGVAGAAALSDCCEANCCCFWRFPRVFW